MGFKDTLKSDHLNMITSDEFGVVCLNNRTSESFDIIKTDAFVMVDGEGVITTEEKPMFNTSKDMINNLGDVIQTDIKQYDNLTIEGQNFIVRDVKNDGIGGLDIYLKQDV